MTPDRELNPMGKPYESFLKILKSITIKYSYKAQLAETTQSKREADKYITALNKMDDVFYYRDYTETEVMNAYEKAIPDINIRQLYSEEVYQVIQGNVRAASKIVWPYLLEQRRARSIRDFEEMNDYYRTLNGYPLKDDPLSSSKVSIKNIKSDGDPGYTTRLMIDRSGEYVTPLIAKRYKIPEAEYMPIYAVEDQLNAISDNHGSYAISAIEGSLTIDKTRANIQAKINKLNESTHDYDKAEAKEIEKRSEYLKYIGSNRIPIEKARKAKNFEIIHINKPDVKQNILDSFLTIYAQCRDYFMKVIYVPQYHDFFEYYDNFIGMCIMIMTLQQVVARQIFATVDRNFFDIAGVRALYEAYSIPFDLNIDEDTQNQIVRNVNLLIQNKATDKVLYNIADLLGFTNIKIYKYYLSRQPKYDLYGAPIIAYKESFNDTTGEITTVPDTNAMYDIYFHRAELRGDNFIESFNDKTNRSEYEEVTSGDPFWWNDEKTLHRIWDTEYNFVESKYLSLGVSYSLTEVIFENVLLLKLILQKSDIFKDITLKLPRIIQDTEVSLFDTIILLICLVAAKHDLYGEIITIPTQVISVLDYIRNKNGDDNLDTLRFNNNYFFNHPSTEDKKTMDGFKNQFINHMKDMNKEENNKIYTTFGYNFDYFSYDNPKREAHLQEVKDLIGADDYTRFKRYVDMLSSDGGETNESRIRTLNLMFTDVKHIQQLLEFCMDKTDNRHVYDALKRIHDALFYSHEVSEVFTMDIPYTDTDENGNQVIKTATRTAYTYFEYLNYINPKLYNAVFYVDMEAEYKKHITSEKLDINTYSYEDFEKDVVLGNIYIDYGHTKEERDAGTRELKDDKIYYYVNHIIGRLELLLKNVQFMYLMANTQTPLEDLLLRLVKFFKSYTVDIIGLETILVCDFKPEMTLRLYDEIAKIYKLIEMHEYEHWSYSDIVRELIAILYPNEEMKVRDQMYYDVLLMIDNNFGLNNSIRTIDKAFFKKIIETCELSLERIQDNAFVTANLTTKDKSLNFKEKVIVLSE